MTSQFTTSTKWSEIAEEEEEKEKQEQAKTPKIRLFENLNYSQCSLLKRKAFIVRVPEELLIKSNNFQAPSFVQQTIFADKLPEWLLVCCIVPKMKLNTNQTGYRKKIVIPFMNCQECNYSLNYPNSSSNKIIVAIHNQNLTTYGNEFVQEIEKTFSSSQKLWLSYNEADHKLTEKTSIKFVNWIHKIMRLDPLQKKLHRFSVNSISEKLTFKISQYTEYLPLLNQLIEKDILSKTKKMGLIIGCSSHSPVPSKYLDAVVDSIGKICQSHKLETVWTGGDPLFERFYRGGNISDIQGRLLFQKFIKYTGAIQRSDWFEQIPRFINVGIEFTSQLSQVENREHFGGYTQKPCADIQEFIDKLRPLCVHSSFLPDSQGTLFPIAATAGYLMALPSLSQELILFLILQAGSVSYQELEYVYKMMLSNSNLPIKIYAISWLNIGKNLLPEETSRCKLKEITELIELMSQKFPSKLTLIAADQYSNSFENKNVDLPSFLLETIRLDWNLESKSNIKTWMQENLALQNYSSWKADSSKLYVTKKICDWILRQHKKGSFPNSYSAFLNSIGNLCKIPKQVPPALILKEIVDQDISSFCSIYENLKLSFKDDSEAFIDEEKNPEEQLIKKWVQLWIESLKSSNSSKLSRKTVKLEEKYSKKNLIQIKKFTMGFSIPFNTITLTNYFKILKIFQHNTETKGTYNCWS